MSRSFENEIATTRKQREDGIHTRKAIVHEAVSLATVEGLEGLSIGELAKALGISKSGVYAHFGPKRSCSWPLSTRLNGSSTWR